MEKEILKTFPMQEGTNRKMAIILSGRTGIGKTFTTIRMLRDIMKKYRKPEPPVVMISMAGQDAGAWGTYPVPVVKDGFAEIQHAIFQTSLNPLLEKNIGNGYGLLILDDVTAADPSVQSALLDTVQFGTIGNLKLGDNVLIALTGNEVTDGSYATAWSQALRSRSRFKSFKPNFKIWEKHNPNVDASVFAFLKNYESTFFAPKASNTKAVDEHGNQPSPRAWSNLGRSIRSWGGWKKFEPTEYDESATEFACSLVGEKAGVAFGTFANEFGVYPTGEEMIANPDLWNKVPKDKKNMLSGAFGVAFAIRSIMHSRFEKVKDKQAGLQIVTQCMKAAEEVAETHREIISFMIAGVNDMDNDNIFVALVDYMVTQPDYMSKTGKYNKYFVQYTKIKKEI